MLTIQFIYEIRLNNDVKQPHVSIRIKVGMTDLEGPCQSHIRSTIAN